MGVHAFAALALLLAGHQQAPALRAPAPCPGSPGYTCSVLDVPLDRTGRRPGVLHLRVAAADNVHAPRGVLLVLAGGPGQPATPIVARFAERALAAERHAYRIVAFDERGTGAGALACGSLQAAMGSSDLAPPPAAAVRSCARKLGVRRQFFGTDDVVADMESLRRALGVETWTLDGVSYGTFVGERYALAHPRRVKRLVLDSVVPHVGETDLGVDEFHATRRVLRAVCGGDACSRDLAATVRRYGDGPRVLDALTLLSIADPTYRRLVDVPAALHSAAQGDRRALDAWLRDARTWQAAPADELDQGLHASALCADWRWPWGSSAAPLAGREAKLRRAVARLPPGSLYPFDRATATGNGFVRQCLPWAPTPPTPLLTGKISVPALLLNGDHDLSTPLEWAREELRLTRNAKLVVVPGAGHSTQSRASSDVGRRAVARFLLAQSAELALHVRTTPVRTSSGRCAFVIVAPVVEGGRQTTCLTSVAGFPGPRTTITSRGTMRFTLRRGAIQARVTVVQRFGADGVHARQTLTGTVAGGTGRYAGARGTISGGGSVVDRRDGLGRVSLAYRIRLS